MTTMDPDISELSADFFSYSPTAPSQQRKSSSLSTQKGAFQPTKNVDGGDKKARYLQNTVYNSNDLNFEDLHGFTYIDHPDVQSQQRTSSRNKFHVVPGASTSDVTLDGLVGELGPGISIESFYTASPTPMNVHMTQDLRQNPVAQRNVNASQAQDHPKSYPVKLEETSQTHQSLRVRPSPFKSAARKKQPDSSLILEPNMTCMSAKVLAARAAAQNRARALKLASESNSYDATRRPVKHTCMFCSKSLNTKYKLERHLRTHTGERPFECQKCDARFNQKSSLKTHSNIHARELLRDPNTTQERAKKVEINGYTLEQLGIPFDEKKLFRSRKS